MYLFIQGYLSEREQRDDKGYLIVSCPKKRNYQPIDLACKRMLHETVLKAGGFQRPFQASLWSSEELPHELSETGAV